MQKDIDTILLTSQEYKHALNATIESFDGNSFSLQNEASNLLAVNINNDNVIGVTYIPSLNISILFTTNNKGRDEILLLHDINFNDDEFNYELGESTPLEKIVQSPISSDKVKLLCHGNFGWNVTHKINIKYKITDCTLNLYFNDGVNDDRFIYFYLNTYELHEDFKQVDAGSIGTCNVIYYDNVDVNKTKFNQSLIFPDVLITEEIGGELKEGVYQVYIAYSTSKGIPLSSYIAGSNIPFPIFDKKIKENEGVTYTTNKALKIDISSLTQSSVYYKYITIVIASTINGNPTVYTQEAVIPIASSISYLYTGSNNSSIVRSASEILAKYPYYKNSALLEVSNNYLFKAGLNEYEKLNIQRIANKLELEAVTIRVKEDFYKHPENNIYKSYVRDEVYAFGIELILDEGEVTGVGHIPNRAANSNDLKVASNTTDNVNGGTYNWQVNNTAYKTSAPHIASNGVWETFDFGYWESTEKYPNNPEIWGTLCNQHIRLHKMPDCSTSHIHDGENINVIGIYNREVYIFPMGVRIKSNLNSVLNQSVQEGIITLEQRKRIKGYKLVRADRAGNKSVIAKGMIYDMWSYEKPSVYSQDDSCSIKSKYFYPNYGFNDLRDDVFLSSTSEHYKYNNFEKGLQSPVLQKFNRQNKYTFHSPDTHFAQPSLGNILKLETEEYGEAKGFFNVAEEQARYKLLTANHYNLAILIAKFIGANTDVTSDNSANIGQAIGSSIGAIAGTTIIPGVGGSVGSMVGGFVGSLLGSNDDVTKELQRNAIILYQTEKLIQLFKNLTDYKKLQYQYQAVGKYKGYKSLLNQGNRQRKILNSAYISPTKQSVNGTLINNTFRESSVYLDVEATLPSCTVQDTSRVKLTSSSNAVVVNGCKKYKMTIDTNALQAQVGGTVTAIYAIYQDCTNKAVKQEYTSGDYYIYATVPPTVGVGLSLTEILSCPECAQFATTTSKVDCNCKGQEITTNISSYYASIKTEKKNQYGNVLGMNYIDVHNNVINIGESNKIFFGGDEYITPFALKRKHAFFNNTTFGLSDETDIFYEDLGNVAYPTYYFNTKALDRKFTPSTTLLYSLSGLSSLGVPTWSFWESLVDSGGLYALGIIPGVIGSIIGTGNNNEDYKKFNTILKEFSLSAFSPEVFIKPPSFYLDCYNNNNSNPLGLFSFDPVDGIMYLYSYGIPYFYCESDVNTFYRNGKNTKDMDFYPNNEDLNNWLQEKNVPISVDNFYFYDRTYSKQAKEGFHFVNDINFKPYEKCKIQFPNRVVYSLQSSELDNSDVRDNFLINRALDYYDFSQTNGKLVGIHGIESEKVLVMFENNTQIFSAFNTLETETGTVQIGNGGIFRSKPQEFSKASLGYSGSQHTAFLSTEFGHVFVDAKRGDVFLLGANGNGLTSMTKDKMRNWFKNHLPFNIIKYFPDVNIDNAFNGIGISLCYDKRYNRIFLTKLDYSPKSKSIIHKDGKYYIGNEEIQLEDKKWFYNHSFTISYSFNVNSWVSFYSFTPKYYLENINYFLSGDNNKLWGHNLTNKSYQVFNGILHSFEIELNDKYSYNNKIMQSVSYQLDVVRYHNNEDKINKENLGFNKAIIYNAYQNTGELVLEHVNSNDLNKCKLYPILDANSTRIIQNYKETVYSFNQFKNRANCNTLQPMFLYDKNGVNKYTNPFTINNSVISNNSFDPIRGTINYVKLINDKHSNYKMIFKLANFNQINSIR